MRTIRDEDKKRDNRVITILDVTAKHATEAAVLCTIGGKDYWVPQSAIDDDSEVYDKGHEGKLVVHAWWAEKNGVT